MQKSSLQFVALIGRLVAACAISSPLAATANSDVSRADTAQAADAGNAADGSRPVALMAFDYDEFFDRATQLGMLSQSLGYTVTVAADGTATDCALARRFRSQYTTKELCKSIARNAQFQPARDAQGNAIAATYQGKVQIYSFFAPNR